MPGRIPCCGMPPQQMQPGMQQGYGQQMPPQQGMRPGMGMPPQGMGGMPGGGMPPMDAPSAGTANTIMALLVKRGSAGTALAAI